MPSPADDRENPAEIQLRLAEERTTLAEQRTWLAEQRTYTAWVRTGLASVATGFAIDKLLDTTDPKWITALLGALFILTGAAMFAQAFLGYRASIRRISDASRIRARSWPVGALSLVMLLGSAVALWLVLAG